MQIKKIEYEGIPNCIECTIAEPLSQKLVITTTFGPRILHLSIGNSKNILFHDKEKEISAQDWYIYGGHRLWISPETQDTYHGDNQECTIEMDTDKVAVYFMDQVLKIERGIQISENAGHFQIKNSITNKHESLYTGSLWSMTCVIPEGTVFFPWGNAGDWITKKIIYWQKWMTDHGTQIGSSQYVEGKDLFLIKPSGEEGKVGTSGYEGFVGITNDGYTFMKKFDRLPTNDYPDDNCAIEVYTCDKFIELETLSPMFTFIPNQTYTHTEEWILLDHEIDPEDGEKVRSYIN